MIDSDGTYLLNVPMFLFNNWQNLTCGTVIGLKANLSELDIPSVKVVSA